MFKNKIKIKKFNRIKIIKIWIISPKINMTLTKVKTKNQIFLDKMNNSKIQMHFKIFKINKMFIFKFLNKFKKMIKLLNCQKAKMLT